jgi:aminoglycoside phosphotransferase (APT) family kinase protein
MTAGLSESGEQAAERGGPTTPLEIGLARALADADPSAQAASVRVTGSASGGATRRTIFVDIVRGGTTTAAVAQLASGGLTRIASTAEAACVRLASRAGVPVAEVLLASDDPSYVGSPFHVSRRVEGMTVPRHVLRAVAARPALGSTLTRQCAMALASLHGIAPDQVPAAVSRLVEPTPTYAYAEHLQSVASSVPMSPVIALGRRWLSHNHPDPPRPALVHGDMRNGNLVVDGGGLAAVIDWELAHVGDPMEDLAWLCLRCWRFLADDRQVGGFGDLADLRIAYEEAGGIWRHDAFHWWKVARTMWWCLVLRLQAEAFESGLSSSLVLAASGRRVAELEYDLLMLIRPTRVPASRRRSRAARTTELDRPAGGLRADSR